MKKTMNITISIDIADYQELCLSPLGVSGAIRKALKAFLDHPEMDLAPHAHIEKLQRVIEKQQEILDSYSTKAELEREANEFLSLSQPEKIMKGLA